MNPIFKAYHKEEVLASVPDFKEFVRYWCSKPRRRKK